jgi:serine/threonine protein kinase
MSIARQIAAAMHYMHTAKPMVFHRDLKPANVLVEAGSYHAYMCT